MQKIHLWGPRVGLVLLVAVVALALGISGAISSLMLHDIPGLPDSVVRSVVHASHEVYSLDGVGISAHANP